MTTQMMAETKNTFTAASAYRGHLYCGFSSVIPESSPRTFRGSMMLILKVERQNSNLMGHEPNGFAGQTRRAGNDCGRQPIRHLSKQGLHAISCRPVHRCLRAANAFRGRGLRNL